MNFQIPAEHREFPLFDEQWYCDRYPEIEGILRKKKVVSARHAFLTQAKCRLHSPGPLFDTPFYQSRSDYAAKHRLDPLTHYVQIGEPKGISPHWLFNEAYYRQKNPDVAMDVESAGWASGFRHFFTTGDREMRRPHPLFCPMVIGGQNPFRAFLLEGQFRDLSPTSLFDLAWYREQTKVVTGKVEEFTSLIHHFLSTGIRQGMTCCPEFDAEFYLRSHPWLRDTPATSAVTAAVRHWLFHGCDAGADPNPYFKGEYYLQANPQVHEEMGEMGLFGEFEHFLLRGRHLGLRCSAPKLLVNNGLAEDAHGFPQLQIAVEETSRGSITGFAYDPGCPDRIFVLEFCQGERFLGCVRADAYHTSHGGRGFTFPIPQHTIVGEEVQIRLAGEISIRTRCRPDPVVSLDAGLSFASTLRYLGRTLHQVDLAIGDVKGQLEYLRRQIPAEIDRFDEIHSLHRKRIPWGGIDNYQLLLSRNIGQMAIRPIVTMIVDASGAQIKDVERSLQSILHQVYPVWEAKIVFDPSLDLVMAEFLDDLCQHDSRFGLVVNNDHGDPAVSLNAAIVESSGDFLGFLEPGDMIEPEALALMLLESQNSRPALIYSDETRIDPAAVDLHIPWLKPDFDYWQLLQWNYIGDLVLVDRDLLLAVGGFASQLSGLHFHDLWLRILENRQNQPIRHLPRVLYKRVSATNNGLDISPRGDDRLQELPLQKIVHGHLHRCGRTAEVTPHLQGEILVSGMAPLLADTEPGVTIIIPTHRGIDSLATCVSSILERTRYERYEILLIDHDPEPGIHRDFTAALTHHPKVNAVCFSGTFNWAAMNNKAVEASDGEVICFLNNDTVVLAEDWLRDLVAQVQQPGVGAAGAQLLYPDGTIQHAGVVIGLGTGANHAFRGLAGHESGYAHQARLRREVSAVTGACLVCQRQLFEKLGGFDAETFAVTFNDVDFCLRIRESGLVIVYVPTAVLYHHESKTRGGELTRAQQARAVQESSALQLRWGEVLKQDHYYSPYWTAEIQTFSTLRVPPALASEELSTIPVAASQGPGHARQSPAKRGDLVLFVHIPKTAGTSFKTALREVYGDQALISDYGHYPGTSSIIREFREHGDSTPLEEAIATQDTTYLCGHYPITKYRAMFPKAQIVTFLRDPIQRLMSEFVHRKFRLGLNTPWEKFVHEGHYHDLQSKQLSGVDLDEITFLGVTEKYEESLKIYSHLIQQELPVRIKNTAVRDLSTVCPVDEQLLQWLKETHAKDYELYNWANGLIDSRLALHESST